MTRPYGWGPRSERLVERIPHGHWKTTTPVAALRLGFSWSRRAEKVHDLGAGDEVELGERHDAPSVERGLEGEVEAL